MCGNHGKLLLRPCVFMCESASVSDLTMVKVWHHEFKAVQGTAVAKLGIVVLGKVEMELRVCFGRWKCIEEDGPSDGEAPARKSGTKAG
jgi:hypothetical protein